VNRWIHRHELQLDGPNRESCVGQTLEVHHPVKPAQFQGINALNATSARAVSSRHRIFVPLAVLVTLIAFIGFWPNYFGPLLNGNVDATVIIHIHAAVFVLWLALFMAQVTLAAAGRLTLHMQLGRLIMAYGAFLIIIALFTAIAVFQIRVDAGNFAEAAHRLFAPVRDMLAFAPLLWAGWIYRTRPEIHKRLMLLATTVLLIAAVGRMAFLGKPVPTTQLMLVWAAPIYIAMGWDWYSRRVVHPVYLMGIALMLSFRLVLPFRDTQAWMSFATWLAGI
jgi:hypothetical protein